MTQKDTDTRTRQQGFTIVELLIATTVLSVILLLVTIMMTNISNLYYRGVNQSRLQDDVRNTTAEIAQHLELNDQAVTPATHTYNGFAMSAYCLGGTRYSYITDTQIGTGIGQIQHVLWRDSYSGTCIPVNLSLANPENGPSAGTNGTELMAPNSMLTALSISANSPFTLSIGMAYGTTSVLNLNGVNSTCKDGAGDDFCATASLTTTVVQRLN
jgi:prepilin-type N-terminal cleavage/methylation domain-containing protein